MIIVYFKDSQQRNLCVGNLYITVLAREKPNNKVFLKSIQALQQGVKIHFPVSVLCLKKIPQLIFIQKSLVEEEKTFPLIAQNLLVDMLDIILSDVTLRFTYCRTYVCVRFRIELTNV